MRYIQTALIVVCAAACPFRYKKHSCCLSDLQMGALDGQRYSNTRWYHTHLAWHGLLIEGDPKSYAALQQNRPSDITVHAAVCEERKTVHFAESSDGAVSGIVE